MVAGRSIQVGSRKIHPPAGGSHPFRADAVAFWDLTSGPQSFATLSSLDLTENGGPLTYDSDGVHLNGTDQWLEHINLPDLQVNDTSFFGVADVLIDTAIDGAAIIAKADNGNPDEWGLTTPLAAGIPYPDLILTGGSGNYPDSGGTANTLLTVGTHGIIFFLHDKPNGDVLEVWVNNGTPASNVVNDPGNPSTTAPFRIGYNGYAGGVFAGKIRHVFLWIGTNAVTIPSDATLRAFLYNGGAGRTASEVWNHTA